VIDHIDGAGEEDLEIGVAGGIGDAFGQEGFTGAGVADQDHIPALRDEVEVEEVEDLGFLVLSGLVVMEVKGVHSDFFVEPGLLEPELDSALQTMFGLGLRQLMEDKEGVAVFLFGLLDDLFEALGHDFESQVEEFFLDLSEWGHDRFLLLMTKAS